MTGLIPGAPLPVRLALGRFLAQSEAELAAAADVDSSASASAAGTTAVAAPALAEMPHSGERAAAALPSRPAPAAAAPAADRGSAGRGPAPDAALSDAGRLLARLAPLPLAEAERGRALEQAVLTQLASSAAADVQAIASQLRGSLEQSGLFYEAHLRDWSCGGLELDDLRREPQARIGPQSAVAPATKDFDDRQEARDPPALPRDAPAASQASLPVPRELERLVREQLATLETRTAVVPLAPWRGQDAMLSITDEPEVRDEGRAMPIEGERAWRATLRMSLPRLGGVEFALTVRGDRVSIGARAREAASRSALAANAGDLESALRRYALALEQLQVTPDGEG
jgi:hypothetical protein